MQKRSEKLELLIAEADETLAKLYDDLNNPEVFSDYIKVGEIQGEIDKITAMQGEYMDEWTDILDRLAEMDK
jgi:ATP-binding cassette subfamily F protein 3